MTEKKFNSQKKFSEKIFRGSKNFFWGEGVRTKVLVYVSNLRLLGSRMLPKFRVKKMLGHKGLK